MKKLLFLSSSVDETSDLNISTEINAIENALKDIDKENKIIELNSKMSVDRDEFAKTIRKEQPTVLHISVHADPLKGLTLKGSEEQKEYITTDDLRWVLTRQQDTGKKIECLVLNGCNTLYTVKECTGLADIIIATKDPIQNKHAIQFSKGFYQLLAEGAEYQEAFNSGIHMISNSSTRKSYLGSHDPLFQETEYEDRSNLDIESIISDSSDFSTESTLATDISKLLILTANPAKTALIDINSEIVEIFEAFQNGDLEDIQIKFRKRVTYSQLRKEILREKPHMVHFSGHGNLTNPSVINAYRGRGIMAEESIDESIILLHDDENRDPFPVDITLLKETLSDLITNHQVPLKLFVINACYTDNMALTISTLGIYVVGARMPLLEKASIKFTGEFYRGLADGHSIEKSFYSGIISLRAYDQSMDSYTLYKGGKKII